MFGITTIGNVDNQAIGRARKYASYVDAQFTIPDFKVEKCIVDSHNVSLTFRDGESWVIPHVSIENWMNQTRGLY